MKHRIVFGYNDIAIEVETTDAGHLNWLKEFLLPAFCVSGDTPDWQVKLEIDTARYDALLKRGSDGTELVAFVQDKQTSRLPCWNSPDKGLLIHDEKFAAFFHINGRQILLLSRDENRRIRTPLMRIVRELAMDSIQQSGKLILHASAFVVENKVVIVTGPKNAGKTSLLIYALKTLGAGYLTNDRLLIGHRPESFMARGLPTIVTIRSGTLALFPDLWPKAQQKHYRVYASITECGAADAEPARLWNPGRLGLAPAQFCSLLNCHPVAEATPTLLLFPRRTGKSGGLSLQAHTPEIIKQRLKSCGFPHKASAKRSQVFTRQPAGGTFDTSSWHDALASKIAAYDCIMGNDAFLDRQASRQLLELLTSAD